MGRFRLGSSQPTPKLILPASISEPVVRVVEREVVIEKPIYVEKVVIKEIEKPIYVDKVVTVEVEKPIYVEKVVYVETPVEVLKEVEKVTYVDVAKTPRWVKPALGLMAILCVAELILLVI